MPPSPTTSLIRDRPRMLALTVLWASRWLMFYGLVVTLAATWMPNVEGTRNHPLSLPSQAALGPALMALGYLVRKGLTRPMEQHLAVDAMILYFLASLIAFFWNVPRVPEIVRLEWLAQFMNVAFLLPLILYRRRASELARRPDEPVPVEKAVEVLKIKLRGLVKR